jgi:hypothetical protein
MVSRWVRGSTRQKIPALHPALAAGHPAGKGLRLAEILAEMKDGYRQRYGNIIPYSKHLQRIVIAST